MAAPDRERFARLLAAPQTWEAHLPPGMFTALACYRASVGEMGNQHGVLTHAAQAAGMQPANFHKSLLGVLARAERFDELKSRKIEPALGMEVKSIAETFDSDGALKSTSVRQAIPAGDVDSGEPRPGFLMKRISTLSRGDGSIIQQWNIQTPEEAARWTAVRAAIAERVEGVKPLPPAELPRTVTREALLAQLTFADLHVGALGWRPETGASNWDLAIAERTAIGGGTFIVQNLPPAAELLILVLGDFLDSDGYAPLTPASKHLLDVDGRFPKISSVGERILEELVNTALRRFLRVRLVFLPGNHDPLSMFWMRRLFQRIYQAEPRVFIEPGIRNLWAMAFGRTMVSATHGDKIKMSRVPTVMACEYPEIWGQTTHRFGHVGHLHHEKDFRLGGVEQDGMLVYQHPTVNSRNAWAAELGLSAARQLVGHCYRREGGLAGKLYFHPDMMDEAA